MSLPPLPPGEAAAQREAIDRYLALLDGDPALAAETAAALDDAHRRRGMYFGDRPLCSVLRPRFLTPAQHAWVRGRVRALLAAFGTLHRIAMEDPAFRAQLRLLDWEEALLADDPGFPHPAPTSRPDLFFTAETGELWLTEYNAETPAAPAYMDVLSEAMLALPAMRAFGRTHAALPLPSRHGVLHALLGAFAAWRGAAAAEAPRILIVDWDDVPTTSEFVFFRDYFRAQGLAAEIADPRALELRDGKLLTDTGFHATLVYKRVLIDELVLRLGVETPLVRAVRTGATCMVNPFRCKVAYKKAAMAVLGDERNAGRFPAEAREVVAAHIPWTRVVEERTTVFEGETIDLVPWIAENRERLLLKPNDDYGGRGIVLGWTVGEEAWRAAVAAALEAPTVVQRRIVLPREPYPSFVDGALQVTDRMLDLAPFVTDGATMAGALTRLSTDPLLNVTAGGGSSVATMLVERL